jgi:CheY-like chemotaxis protein
MPVTTVLYIEDNLANLRLVETILARVPGVEVISAQQARLGLELARTHEPNLILLDLHLPDITGEEVAIALRGDIVTRDIPIVVLSADAYSSQRRRLLNIGVDAYLTKPFNVAELIELVERHVVDGRPRRV